MGFSVFSMYSIPAIDKMQYLFQKFTIKFLCKQLAFLVKIFV